MVQRGETKERRRRRRNPPLKNPHNKTKSETRAVQDSSPDYCSGGPSCYCHFTLNLRLLKDQTSISSSSNIQSRLERIWLLISSIFHNNLACIHNVHVFTLYVFYGDCHLCFGHMIRVYYKVLFIVLLYWSSFLFSEQQFNICLDLWQFCHYLWEFCITQTFENSLLSAHSHEWWVGILSFLNCF